MQWLFFTAIGLLFVSAVFFNRNPGFHFIIHKQIIIFFVLSIFFCLMSYVAYFFIKKQHVDTFLQKHSSLIVYGTMLVVFALQIVYAYMVRSELLHDVRLAIVNAQARTPYEFDWIEYFSLFRNNLYILFFFRAVYSILSLVNLENNFEHVLIAINILFINASIIMGFHVVKSALGVYKAYVAWIFMLVLIVPSPWLVVPYTDTLSMPFAIGIVFLYLQFLKSVKGKKIALALAIGMTAQLGFLFKASAVIPLIAVFVIQFIDDLRSLRQNNSLRQSKKIVRNTRRSKYNSSYVSHYFSELLNNFNHTKHLVLYSILGMVLTGILFTSYLRMQNTIPITENMAIPPEHWIMMGMYPRVSGDRIGYGVFNEHDTLFTLGFENRDEKRAANREVIGERLRAFGVVGYTRFLVNKARFITCDGTFFWGEYTGQAYGYNIVGLRSHVRNFVMPYGVNYSYFAHFVQGIWLFVLFWFFAYAFVKKNTSNLFINICICALIGLILFILLTEARSRYLVNHLPLFAIVSSFCFSHVYALAKASQKERFGFRLFHTHRKGLYKTP